MLFVTCSRRQTWWFSWMINLFMICIVWKPLQRKANLYIFFSNELRFSWFEHGMFFIKISKLNHLHAEMKIRLDFVCEVPALMEKIVIYTSMLWSNVIKNDGNPLYAANMHDKNRCRISSIRGLPLSNELKCLLLLIEFAYRREKTNKKKYRQFCKFSNFFFLSSTIKWKNHVAHTSVTVYFFRSIGNGMLCSDEYFIIYVFFLSILLLDSLMKKRVG